jgi:hypothetical protein
MKLYLHDNGDESVGISQTGYSVDVPFNRDDVDFETLVDFKKDIVRAYSYFCEGKIKALYDFEVEAIESQCFNDDE